MLGSSIEIGGGGAFLPLAGGTMTGNLLFTDDTYYIGDATHGLKGIYLTGCLIKALADPAIGIRNEADTAYLPLYVTDIYFNDPARLFLTAALAEFNAKLDATSAIQFKASTAAARQEVARMQNNADPYLHIGYGDSSRTYGVAIRTVIVTKAHDSDLFDAVGLTDSVVIWAQPAGSVLLGIKAFMTAQFVAASMTDLDVVIGDAGDNDGLFVKAMNLTTDAANTAYTGRGAYWDTSAEGVFWYANAATNWTAYATAVGANLSTTSAGSISFYITYLDIP